MMASKITKEWSLDYF